MSAPERLSADEVARRLPELHGWELADDALRRTFRFDDFIAAFGFMAKVAVLAERAQHHPDWRNVWNRVEIALSTHDAGGITEKDFALAAEIDGLA